MLTGMVDNVSVTTISTTQMEFVSLVLPTQSITKTLEAVIAGLPLFGIVVLV